MAVSSDFPFESRYSEVLGSRIHYIERGEGRVFLFLHGNPTWSYLWRNVIPPIAEHGRCIAFDLVGFGKSDKPRISYRFLDHYKYVDGFIREMGLREIVLVGHDWGGVLATYYALKSHQNVKGIALMETFPFTFGWDYFPPKFRRGFRLFRTPIIGHFLIMVMNVFVNQVLPASVYGGISKEIHTKYKEPFPTVRSRYPVYVWPNELPIEGRENEAFKVIKEIQNSLREFQCPMLLVTCSPGAIIGRAAIEMLEKNVPNLTLADVGAGLHFLQEDNPVGIAQAIIQWATKENLIPG